MSTTEPASLPPDELPASRPGKVALLVLAITVLGFFAIVYYA